MGALFANLAVALAILLLAVASLLAVVGAIAWRRLRQTRLLLVAAGMVVLATKGWLHLRSVHTERAAIASGEAAFPVMLALDMVLVGLLYVAVLKR